VRVVLACPYAWDAPGGVQIHVRQLADKLRRNGHEVLVLAPGSGASSSEVTIVGRPVRVRYRGTVAPICWSPASWKRVRDALTTFGPDVVHAHEPFSPSTSMLAVLGATAPVVATFHAWLDRSRLQVAAAPLLRRVGRRIHVPIAVSDAAASFAGRAFPVRFRVIPNGLEVKRFAQATPAPGLPEGRRVLWVNRLDPQKGFRVAVAAFVRVCRDLDDVSMIVVGDGPDRDTIARVPPGIVRRVLLVGEVSHELLPPYHAAADVFLAPATGQESFGYVLVEAMAAGLPIVASDIPGYREVVRHGVEGVLVRPRDAAALAAGLRRVLDDPHLARELGEAGRARAAQFDWERVIPRIEEAYRDARALA
jgi:phosphatidyl-myo-inositol alpha-mannosyltransferase